MSTERYIDDKSDLDPRTRPSKILQALSPEVAPGSDWPSAQAGDFVVSFEDGSEKLVPRVPGVSLIPIMFLDKAVEWPAERGSRSAPIAYHDYVPADAEWIDVGGRKACIRSSNGNRIEKTIFVPSLVEGFRTTFTFKSTAYAIGQSFGRDADKARAEVDGELVRVCVAVYRLTSEVERNQRGQTWYGPRFEKLGVLGQSSGPTLEQARVARDLRFELKAEEERQKKARSDLFAVRPTPALPRGSVTITSGVERPRSWADPRPAESVDPKPAAQPPKTVDPKLDDPIDDIPW